MKPLYHGYNDAEEFWEDAENTVAIVRKRGTRKWIVAIANRRGEKMTPSGIEAAHIVDAIQELNRRGSHGEYAQNTSKEWTLIHEEKPMVLKPSNPAIV